MKLALKHPARLLISRQVEEAAAKWGAVGNLVLKEARFAASRGGGEEKQPLWNGAALSTSAGASRDAPGRGARLTCPGDSTGTCCPLCPCVPKPKSTCQETWEAKLKRQSLQQRKLYCRARQGQWAAHASKTLIPGWRGGKVFTGKIWGEGCRAV